MPMVICQVCERLVHAIPRGTIALSEDTFSTYKHPNAEEFQRNNPRAQAWYPVNHPALGQDTGGRVFCGGSTRPH